MPKLWEYKYSDGYYVKSRVKGAPVTYQTTDRAIEILCARAIHPGEEIPRDLFFSLLKSGDLYTNGTGTYEDASTAMYRELALYGTINTDIVVSRSSGEVTPKRIQIASETTEKITTNPSNIDLKKYDGFVYLFLIFLMISAVIVILLSNNAR